MEEKRTIDLDGKIKNEINYARAVTALMMAVKAEAANTDAHRAELRLNDSYTTFESDIEKRAS